MHEKLNESVKVLVSFDGLKVKPIFFEWRGKKYKVQKVNLIYQAREEGKKIFYFSVNDEANCFNLRFDPEGLSWSLTELYSDG